MQQYFENRVKYLAGQKAAEKNPYPHKFFVTLSILEYIKKYEALNNGDHLEDVTESLAGIGNLRVLHICCYICCNFTFLYANLYIFLLYKAE